MYQQEPNHRNHSSHTVRKKLESVAKKGNLASQLPLRPPELQRDRVGFHQVQICGPNGRIKVWLIPEGVKRELVEPIAFVLFFVFVARGSFL